MDNRNLSQYKYSFSNGFPSASNQTQNLLNNRRQSPSSSERPSSPCTSSMSSYFSRLQTFHNWPNHIRASKETLAEAGLFYLNLSDRTKCFYCNGGLQNWEYNDDPWVEHAKWFPNCEFVNYYKKDLVTQRNASQGYDIPPVMETPTFPVNPLSMTQKVPIVVPDNLSRSSAPNNIALQESSNVVGLSLENIMKSSVVKSVEGFGYDIDLIKLVVQKRLENGQDINSVEILLDEVMDAEDNPPSLTNIFEHKNQDSSDSVMLSTERKRYTGLPEVMLTEKMVPVCKKSDLESKYLVMTKEKICKVCLTKDRNCVFMPCGHLSCCEDCSFSLRKCPICREPITKIIKIFY